MRRCITTVLGICCACGGDGTSPDVPNVAGAYRVREAVAAVTCTPTRPPATGGTVILDAFSYDYAVRIRQDGTRLTVTDPEFPEDTLRGSVDTQGAVTLSQDVTFREEPREGGRVFYVDLAIQQNLRRSGGTGLRGSGAYVNVFHEGAPTAPVFATCSRTSTLSLTRTGE